MRVVLSLVALAALAACALPPSNPDGSVYNPDTPTTGSRLSRKGSSPTSVVDRSAIDDPMRTSVISSGH